MKWVLSFFKVSTKRRCAHDVGSWWRSGSCHVLREQRLSGGAQINSALTFTNALPFHYPFLAAALCGNCVAFRKKQVGFIYVQSYIPLLCRCTRYSHIVSYCRLSLAAVAVKGSQHCKRPVSGQSIVGTPKETSAK